MTEISFEWDDKKAATNEIKHGVIFDEASTVFSDISAITFLDPYSPEEERFIILGYSADSRLLLTVFCERGHNTFRIISARRATRKERKIYEEGI